MYRPTPERDGRFGFTLIELLIVVAIIAILAAIAIPNFLEAQTRSRVSRAKGDLRTHGLALDSYFVDHNHYTKDSSPSLDANKYGASGFGIMNEATGVFELTTPIAYLSTVLNDPFEKPGVDASAAATAYIIASGDWSYPTTITQENDNQNSYETFKNHGAAECYALISPGPDMQRNLQSYKCFPWRPEQSVTTGVATFGTQDSVATANASVTPQILFYLDYDPSNGTVSSGDVQRFGGDFMSGNWNRFYQNSDGKGNGPTGPAAW
jgi:prepilin-type N-terminal cleavage/methylation domain-containing protein